MPVSLNSNRDSLHAQTQLAKTSNALSKTFERLSSGMRINSAADDAAGLAVADGLRADAKLAAVAVRNANDGISLLSIADAGLSEIGNILSRLGELANQSANGVYTNAQRSAISSEFVSLASEIQRISAVATFNDISLLSNSGNVTLQVGLANDVNSRITVSGVLGTLQSLGLSGANSALTYSVIADTTANSQSAALNALSAVNSAIDLLGASRGVVGAAQSRLESAVAFLQVARENFVAAESRIRDADVAQEVAEMTRLQVLQQATTAVLAQANIQPQIALALLK